MMSDFRDNEKDEMPNDLLFSDEYICWSRMQSEAGQNLESIIQRKEYERVAGSGVFFWGVGNAPARPVSKLVKLKIPVKAVFSIMKSKPKIIDVSPKSVLIWRRYVDTFGVERALPEGVVVTSRGDTEGGAKRRHYALMCFSDRPLELKFGTPFHATAYRNAGGLGGQVGYSQVTALLRKTSAPVGEYSYEVNMEANLFGSYWVRLSDPMKLDTESINAINRFSGNIFEWKKLAELVRADEKVRISHKPQGELLL